MGWPGGGYDPFRTGIPAPKPGPHCPYVNDEWSNDTAISKCESLCASDPHCIAFTWYPRGTYAVNHSTCCFRSIDVSDKPSCEDPSCKGIACYEKPERGPIPQISELSVTRLPVEGFLPVTVTLTEPLPSEDHDKAECVFNPNSAGLGVTTKAVVTQNGTRLLCQPPKTGLLTVGAGDILIQNSYDGRQSKTANLYYYSVATMSVGKRPYIHEGIGHILLSSTFPDSLVALHGKEKPHTCTVKASLRLSGAVLSRDEEWRIGPNEKKSFEFDLGGMEETIEDTVVVTVKCESLKAEFIKHRAFQRYPGKEAPRGYSQIDFSTGSIQNGGTKTHTDLHHTPGIYSIYHTSDCLILTLTVNGGEAFLAQGWYYSMMDNANINMTALITQQVRNLTHDPYAYFSPLFLLYNRPEWV